VRDKKTRLSALGALIALLLGVMAVVALAQGAFSSAGPNCACIQPSVYPIVRDGPLTYTDN
jgi:hypothetical protein